VVTALATTLGVGAVTAFTIAFTLLQIPVGLIGVPLGIVLFPSLSHEVATGDMAAFRGLLGRALRAIIVVMLPVAVLTALLRTETVALLFPTFSAADVRQTADTLLAFSLGLVAHALIAVLARGFYAQQDTRTPVVAAILAVAINTTLAAVLIRPLGLPGVGLAIAVAAWLETATLAVLLWRRVHGLDTASLVSVAVRTAVAAAVGGAVGLALQVALGSRLLPDPVIGGLERTPSLLAVMLVVSAGVAGGFVAGALALRITELRSIVGLMIDALRRPRRS
jgi:putative peptidoglycan lipid II flippase